MAVPSGCSQDGIDHLAHGLRGKIDMVVGTSRCPGAGIQQPQVVVYLGDRAHCRAGIVRGRLLFDGDGRGQTFDRVDVRLFHHRQELTGVGGQGLHVAPLSLGINRVECQRRLAGTRKTGQYDESIARQVEIDILQIVGPGTPDADILHVTDYYTPGVKGGYMGPRLARRGSSFSMSAAIT